MTQGIRILCPSWIRIRIRNADPDPGGRSLKITKEKNQGIVNNCNSFKSNCEKWEQETNCWC